MITNKIIVSPKRAGLVSTYELSLRMKEVWTEPTYYYWYVNEYKHSISLVSYKNREEWLADTNNFTTIADFVIAPNFTEILTKLPDAITDQVTGQLCSFVLRKQKGNFVVYYEGDTAKTQSQNAMNQGGNQALVYMTQMATNPTDALAMTYLWLYRHGYLTETKHV